VLRRILSVVALALSVAILIGRIEKINEPARVELAARTRHLLYLDSLRTELLTFAEQYGRPVFQYDTTAPVTGHGRIQLARLRQALFDQRIEYGFNDRGFYLEWRGDPRPRQRHGFSSFAPIGSVARYEPPPEPISSAWPQTAAEYARIRREFVTPRWPEIPQRRINRPRRSPVPPHGDALSAVLAIAAGH
jgi:hypothetical protein